MTYTSADATGTLEFTPVANQLGAALITVTVEDAGADGDINTLTDNAIFSRDFAVEVMANPEIHGTKYHDLDGDGEQDVDEPGLAGWTIYLDTNENGILDDGELSTVTVVDDPATTGVDEAGRYSFVGLPVGTYNVTEVQQSGWYQTSPRTPGFYDEQPLVTDATHELKSADLNADGHLDLVSVNRETDQMKVVLNNGDGTFATPVSYAVGDFPEFLDVGDLDADGDLDVVVTNAHGATNFTVFMNAGDGTFVPETPYTLSNLTQDVELTDLDADGDLDALVYAGAASAELHWLLNDGTGTFTVTSLGAVVGGGYLATGDVDGDGDIDAALTENPNVGIYLNDGTGAFAGSTSYSSASSVRGILLEDVDGDGSPDLIYNDSGGNTVSVRLNDGSGVFGIAATFTVGSTPNWIDAGDVDRDGDIDLAVAHSPDEFISILLNDGAGSFAPALNLPTSDDAVALGDYNGDGWLDVANSSGIHYSRLGTYRVTVAAGEIASGFNFGNRDVGVQIIDDGDAGFLIESGTWGSAGGGVNSNIRFAATGDGSAVASWTFTGLVAGQYRVSATWAAHNNRATDSPFTIYDGATERGTVDVDQQLVPSGSPELTDLGAAWQDLGGLHNIAGDTLVVRLTNDANQYVIADAVRIERIGDLPPASGAQIIDNGETGFAIESGTWGSAGGGVNSNIRFAATGDGSAVASWTFTGLVAGQYRVSATWAEHNNRATDSPFTIYDGATERGTVDVDQQLVPSGSPELTDLGAAWHDLAGPYNITGDTLVVRLTNDANQFVIADAIRIERIDDLP